LLSEHEGLLEGAYLVEYDRNWTLRQKPKTAIGPVEGSSFLNVRPLARLNIRDVNGLARVYVSVTGYRRFAVQVSPSVGQDAVWSEILRLSAGKGVFLLLDEEAKTNRSMFYRCVAPDDM
jgi:hypothetical protein